MTTITGPELGLIMSGTPRDCTTACRAAQRLGMPPIGPGHRRSFTLGQVVATMVVGDLIGAPRRLLLDRLPDVIDHERPQFVLVVPGAPEPVLEWARDHEGVVAFARRWPDHVVLVFDVAVVVGQIADRIGRQVAA